MVQGVCEKLQSGPDEVEELEVQPCVMRKGPYHPSDADLLENALGEHDTANGSDIEGHLADCLYCRIRLDRIKIIDPRLEPPAYAVPSRPVSDETLELLAANPLPKVEAGQVWLAQGDRGQLMVWIGRLRSDAGAALVRPVTPNIDAVDDSALIVELPNVGPVGVFSSLVGSVDVSRLVAHLGDLDIDSDLRRLDKAARNGTRTDLRTGRPITDPADERHEFYESIMYQLDNLDPIIESADEDDDMLADGWEPGLIYTIPGPCHLRHPSEPDLLGCALDELDGPAGADLQAHLADCLFCRIRVNRMMRCDPRLKSPRYAPTRLHIPEEILGPLAADSPVDVKPGQVWLAGRPGEQVMVWVRGVFPHAIMVHAVTPDIDFVEDLSLIVDLSAIGRPVAVVSSVSNAVPRKTLVAHLGDLDVKSDIRDAREAALSRNATALRTGRPITDPADVRNEFLHMLADDLAALDQQADTPVLAGATAAANPGAK